MRVTGLLSGLRNDPLGAQNGVKLRFFVPLPVCALYLVRQFYSVFFALGLFSTVVGAGGFCEESFLWVGGKKVKREREREREKFASSYGVYVTIYPKKEKRWGGGGEAKKKRVSNRRHRVVNKNRETLTLSASRCLVCLPPCVSIPIRPSSSSSLQTSGKNRRRRRRRIEKVRGGRGKRKRQQQQEECLAENLPSKTFISPGLEKRERERGRGRERESLFWNDRQRESPCFFYLTRDSARRICRLKKKKPE